MRHVLILASAGLLVGGIAAAQTEGADSGDLMEMTCGQLASVDLAASPGVIYYLAGYQAGVLSGGAGGAGTAGAGAASAVATQGGDAAAGSAEDTAADADATEAAGMGGMPELDADAIAEACRAAPDSTVVEMIEMHGGGGN